MCTLLRESLLHDSGWNVQDACHGHENAVLLAFGRLRDIDLKSRVFAFDVQEVVERKNAG